MVLVNNGDRSTALTLKANRAFTFTQRYAANTAYNVTVPKSPNMQYCGVVSGSGKLPATASLSVTCTGLGKLAAATPFYTVDGASSKPASVTVNTIASIAGQADHRFTPSLPGTSTLNYPYKAASDGTYLCVTEATANTIRQIRLSDNVASNFLDAAFRVTLLTTKTVRVAPGLTAGWAS